MARPQNIVVLAHDASLSGAPILLSNLLQLLQNGPDFQVKLLVIQRPGPLLEKYRSNFQVILLKPAGYAKERNWVQRLAGILFNRLKLCKVMWRVATADLVFSNTVVNGNILRWIKWLRKPVITYIHELQHVLELYEKTGETTGTLRYSSLLAYPSIRVKMSLMDLYGISEQRMGRLSYYLPVGRQELLEGWERASYVRTFKHTYGLREGCLLVVGMGKIGRRKGSDIFVEIAAAVVRLDPNVQFCWIGDGESEEEEAVVRELVAAKGLEEDIVFTGPLKHDYNNLAAFDLFLLSSREDPYPLVVLEAALMGIPSVCFEQSGGIAEFVGQDAGWVINGAGFSIPEAAAVIKQINEQRAQLEVRGRIAQEKCLQWHGDPTRVLQQFNALLNQVK